MGILNNAKAGLASLLILYGTQQAGCVYVPPSLEKDQEYLQIRKRIGWNDAAKKVTPAVNERNVKLVENFKEYFANDANRAMLEEKLAVSPTFSYERGGYWLFKDGTFVFNELENENWTKAVKYVEELKKKDLTHLDDLLRTINSRIEMIPNSREERKYLKELHERCASLRTDNILLETPKMRNWLLKEYLENVAANSYYNSERDKHIAGNPETYFASCHFHDESPPSWKDTALTFVLCPEVVLMFGKGKIVGVEYLSKGEQERIWPLASKQETDGKEHEEQE